MEDKSQIQPGENVWQHLENLETQLFVQLALALREVPSSHASQNNHLQEIQEYFAEFYKSQEGNSVKKVSNRKENVKQENNKRQDLTTSNKNISDEAAFLEKLHSFLLLLDCQEDGDVCVCKIIPQSAVLTTDAFVGQQLINLTHPEDRDKFRRIFRKTSNTDSSAALIAPEIFKVRFTLKKEISKDNNNNDKHAYVPTTCCALRVSNLDVSKLGKVPDGLAMCLVMPDRLDDGRVSPGDTGTAYSTGIGAPFSISVTSSTKAPPNMTVRTRNAIPRPEIFTTKQDITGKITAIDIRQPNQRKAGQTNAVASPELQDRFKRCIRAFFETRSGGSSLAHILHSRVLNQNQVVSPTYKFSLPDGSTATAQTKSKLMEHPGHQGEAPFIWSQHSIYRDGTFESSNVQNLPSSIRSVLSGASSTSRSKTPPTSTTKSSSTVNPMNPSNLPNDLTALWHNSTYVKPRNSAEVARELLASTGVCGDAEKIVNEVLSPPPHLDGHLVHSVGGAKPANAANGGVSPNCASTSSNEVELGYRTGVTCIMTSGPPCVDLADYEKEGTIRLPPSPPTSSVGPMFVNGITTMRKEATITTARAANPKQSSTPLSNHPASPFPPTPPQSRARSTSLNTATVNVSTPKRCTSAQEGGAQEGQSKPSRKRIKSKSSSVTKQSKLLTELLISKNVPESSLLGTSVFSSSTATRTVSTTAPVTSHAMNHVTTAYSNNQLASPHNAESLSSMSTTSPAAMFDDRLFESPPTFGGQSIVNVSQEEMEELHEILDSFKQNEVPNRTFQEPFVPEPPVQDLNYNLVSTPSQFVSSFPGTDLNNNSLMTVPDKMQIDPSAGQDFNPNLARVQNFMNPQMGFPPDPAMPQQAPLVPTGTETCPNRVVSGNGTMSPQVHLQTAIQSRTPQYTGYSMPDNWEGQEPLIDLGSFPPPTGVNPRMEIPFPNNRRLARQTSMPLQSGNRLQNTMRYQLNNRMSGTVLNNGVDQLPINTVPHQNLPNQSLPMGEGAGLLSPGNYHNPSMHMGKPRIVYSMQDTTPMNVNAVRSPPTMLRHQLPDRFVQAPVNDPSSEIFRGIGNTGIPQPALPQYPYQRLPIQNERVQQTMNIQRRSDLMKQRMTEHLVQMAPSNGMNRQSNSAQMSGGLQHLHMPQTHRASYSTPAGNAMSFSPLAASVNNDLQRHHPVSQMVSPASSSMMSNANLPRMMTSPPGVHQFNDTGSTMTSPVAKPTKKPRVRKSRKTSTSKNKPGISRNLSSEEVTWNRVTSPTHLFSSVYRHPTADISESTKFPKKQRSPVLQLTLGDIHQRPQATFTDGLTQQLGGSGITSAVQNNMTSSNLDATSQLHTDGSQKINLNVLLEQYQKSQPKPSETSFGSKTGTSMRAYDVSTRPIMSSGPWKEEFNDVNGAANKGGFDPNKMIFGTSTSHGIHANNSSSIDDLFLPTSSTGCDVTMNTNVNNNTEPCRYRGSVTSAAIINSRDFVASAPTVTSQPQEAMRVGSERKSSLLETLLLSKD